MMSSLFLILFCSIGVLAQFIVPPADSANQNSSTNLQWQVGSQQTISWNLPASDVGARVDVRLVEVSFLLGYIAKNISSLSMEWIVDLQGSNNTGNMYGFWVYLAGATTQLSSVMSHFVNFTDAAVTSSVSSSSSTVTVIPISTTPSTSTSSATSTTAGSASQTQAAASQKSSVNDASTTQASKPAGLSSGAKGGIGAAVGGATALFLTGLGIFYWRRRKIAKTVAISDRYMVAQHAGEFGGHEPPLAEIGGQHGAYPYTEHGRHELEWKRGSNRLVQNQRSELAG